MSTPSQTPDDRYVTRRSIVAGAAATVGVAVTGTARSEGTDNGSVQAPQDPTKVPGRPAGPLGTRAATERPRRLPAGSPPASSRTPLQELGGVITPSDLHFERHHAGIPAVDPASYRLLIHGMVDRPMVFSLEDLKRFPAVSRVYFLECSGNGGAGYGRPREARTPQQIDGLTSTSEWIGVPLATLFEEVGAHGDATWFLAEGMDAAVMTRSIPVEKAFDDALIAYGQNGEALRPEQGYPARLFLPGWEGNACVKWIRRIELASQPFMTREETSKYTDPLSDGTARQFSFVMDAKSLITFPAYPTRLTRQGFWEIKGLAWSGRGRITQVDVSVDGGRSWNTAQLQEPVLPKCHTRFRFPWRWDGQEALLMSRAVDDTGYVQPTVEALRAARGPATHYHYNNIRAWRVNRDGTVVFGLED